MGKDAAAPAVPERGQATRRAAGDEASRRKDGAPTATAENGQADKAAAKEDQSAAKAAKTKNAREKAEEDARAKPASDEATKHKQAKLTAEANDGGTAATKADAATQEADKHQRPRWARLSRRKKLLPSAKDGNGASQQRLGEDDRQETSSQRKPPPQALITRGAAMSFPREMEDVAWSRQYRKYRPLDAAAKRMQTVQRAAAKLAALVAALATVPHAARLIRHVLIERKEAMKRRAEAAVANAADECPAAAAREAAPATTPARAAAPPPPLPLRTPLPAPATPLPTPKSRSALLPDSPFAQRSPSVGPLDIEKGNDAGTSLLNAPTRTGTKLLGSPRTPSGSRGKPPLPSPNNGTPTYTKKDKTLTTSFHFVHHDINPIELFSPGADSPRPTLAV